MLLNLMRPKTDAKNEMLLHTKGINNSFVSSVYNIISNIELLYRETEFEDIHVMGL